MIRELFYLLADVVEGARSEGVFYGHDEGFFLDHLFFGLNILNYNVDVIIMGTIKEFIPFSLKDFSV